MIYSTFPPGILIIGGEPTAVKNSVEFWSATDPEEGSCELADYPRSMWGDQTADFVSGRIVACYDRSCEFYQEGHWTHLHDTIESRKSHSTATIKWGSHPSYWRFSQGVDRVDRLGRVICQARPV